MSALNTIVDEHIVTEVLADLVDKISILLYCLYDSNLELNISVQIIN